MKKLVFLALLLFISMNCENNDDNDLSANDCLEIACTEEFITLIVTIKDDSGNAISLDTFRVFDESTSSDVTIDLSDSGWQRARQDGEYPLYDDSFVSGNLNTSRTLIFSGFVNGEKTTEHQFEVNTNCCHVHLISGNSEIIVN